MIVRKSQQFEWDCLSLETLEDDVRSSRTRDIADGSQDPLVIILAEEAIIERLEKKHEQ